jgi:IclR family pca regulon transcriptional regulator
MPRVWFAGGGLARVSNTVDEQTRRTDAASLATPARKADHVQSLQRGLAVIRAFDADEPALTLSEVVSATGLPRAAARRFVLTLVRLGYIRDEGRLFRLSPRVLELGQAYLSSLRLPEAALPHLRALADDVHESATIAVLDETDIVYVAHVPARRIMSISINIGTRDPAFATSLGRVLLSGVGDDRLEPYFRTAALPPLTARTVAGVDALRTELSKVRRQGFALVDQELEEGLRAIAAPIHGGEGDVIAALNLAVHAGRWPLRAIRRELLPRLLETAAAIEVDLAAETPSRTARTRASTVADVPRAAREADGLSGRDTDFVRSLQRGLAVIAVFDADHPALTLNQVVQASGLARTAARRFLLTLVDLRYMRVQGRLFRLGPRLLELGRPYLSSLTLPELALPHLRELVAGVGESATVAVLDGAEIVYIAHARARRIFSVSVDIGGRDSAFATSLGRVLLAGQSDAWLEGCLASTRLEPFTRRTVVDPAAFRSEIGRVRRQGFAVVDQELEDGLRAVAVPVHDKHDRVVAAVNVSGHVSRWTIEAIRADLLPQLVATAAAIERDVRAAV